MIPALAAGDVFCTRDPRWIGGAIAAVESFWETDGRADFSHAGILLGPQATTFEALWRIGRQDLRAAYAGKPVLVGRHRGMTPERFAAGWRAVGAYEGRRYPFWRLGLHLIPPLARFVSTGRFLVRSELVARFLLEAGLLDHYKGVTPGYLADAIARWDDFDVIFRGALPAVAAQENRSGLPPPDPELDEGASPWIKP